MINLYVNKNRFFKYVKQRSMDLSSGLITLFIDTLLSKELFINYQLRDKDDNLWNRISPKVHYIKLGDENKSAGQRNCHAFKHVYHNCGKY